MHSTFLGSSRLARIFATRRLTGLVYQVGWVIAPYGAIQIIRLGTNIVLARLLAPEFFGIMLLVNALRTGAELLSDIGIGQSVVRSANGDDRHFLNVAWTLQVVRGALLSVIMLAAALPVSTLYGRPELLPIIIAVSPIFLLSGLQSPSLFSIQRHMKLPLRAAYDLICIVFQCAFSIALAYIMPSVWALVWSLVVSVAFSTFMSFVISRHHWPRFAWNRVHVGEILNFGKWIFLSTAAYFAATSYDRMYFVAVLSISLAGVYGIARTFSDLLGQLAQRTGTFLVFPKVASFQHRRAEVAPRLRSTRRKTLAMVAVAAGLAVAGADQFILIAYDPRYHAAAFMIPILLITSWFSVLSAFGDSMLMGCGRPAPGAYANVLKFLTMLVGLWLAVQHASMLEALLVLMLAEIVRWIVLLPASVGEKFMKPTDDLQLTVLMLAIALATKLALGSLGLVPTLAQWWAMHGLLHV